MITALQIASLIKEPERLGSVNHVDLSALADKYPYTQLFSILYLQSLAQQNDLRFDEELLRHSYRITDRARLYRLIHDHQTISETPLIEDAYVENGIEKKVEPEATEIATTVVTLTDSCDQKEAEIEQKILSEVEIREEEALPIVEVETSETEAGEIEDVIAESSANEHASEEIASETEEISEEIENSPDPLEQIILQHAVATSYQLEELTPEEVKQLEKRQEEKLTHANSSNQEFGLDAESDLKYSFTSWLSSNRNALPEDKEEQNAVRSLVHEIQNSDPSEELFGEIEKPKKEFFSPIRKAKESLREDDLPVSETLAKIYEMQGNYPRAIRAYEQLSLIYPEKKTLFATLIADLEQKLNLK